MFMKKIAVCLSILLFVVFVSPVSVFATEDGLSAKNKQATKSSKDNIIINGPNIPCNIKNDGYFEDWENKPKAKLDYDSWETDRKGEISMMTDGENFYFYATYKARGTFDSSGFRLEVDGKQSINMELKLDKPNAQFTKLQVKDNTWTDIGTGYLTAKFLPSETVNPTGNPKNVYEIEFVVPIKNLNKHGVYADKIETLKFSNWSYGKGSITIQGTSTGAIFAIISLVAIACVGYFYNKKKKAA